MSLVRSRARSRRLVLGGFALLVSAWLWPLPRVLDTELLEAPYGWDAKLNAHLIAEGRDRLVALEDPWQSRIFHPHADVRTWSENLFALSAAAIALPRLSPIGVHNLLLLLGCALGGLATWELFRWRGRSVGAALVGALVFTFAPFRLMHLGRIQLSVTVAIPLLFLAFERASRDPRPRRWLVVGALFVLQLGLGMYYAVYLALLLATMQVVLLCHARDRLRRLLTPLPAALITGLLAAAITTPYVGAHETHGFDRSEGELEATSGRLADLAVASDSMLAWDGLQEVLGDAGAAAGALPHRRVARGAGPRRRPHPAGAPPHLRHHRGQFRGELDALGLRPRGPSRGVHGSPVTC